MTISIILILMVLAIIVGGACLVFDVPKVGIPALFIALGLVLFGVEKQASDQREKMHQCLKDGGQWVQYSRSGFECVRGVK